MLLLRIAPVPLLHRDDGISIGNIFLSNVLRGQKSCLRPHDTVAEIAEKCGFCSTEYFSYVFKQSMGMCAVDYRKKISVELE
jgi:AraC-like DNA-binding protein